MRQYYYLVTYEYDEFSFPKKIFLQESEAVRWGRRQATMALKETGDENITYVLYRQEITRTGQLQRVKYLYPYKEEEK